MRLRGVSAGLTMSVVLLLATAAGAWAVPPVKVGGSEQGTVPVADCGSFEVLDEFTLNSSGTEHYDQDGNLIRVVEHIWGTDRLYNADTGKSLSPASFNQSETVEFVDGVQLSFGGIIYRVTVPGSGAVFLDVGRFIVDLDEGPLFLAGPHQFVEGDFEGLCAALS